MHTTNIVPGTPKPRSSRLRRATLAVAGFVALLYLLEWFVAERFWWSALLTYVPQHWVLLLPTTIFIIALLRRRWRIAAANLGILVFVAIVLMGFRFVGKLHRATPNAAPDLRLMTFNIEHGKAGISRITEVIQAQHPDIVCLNEVNGEDGATNGTYAALQRALPDYRFTPASESVIASRVAFSNAEVMPLANFGKRRPIVKATVSPNGKTVTIMAAHLAVAATPETMQKHRGTLADYIGRTVAARQAQTTQILDVVAQQQGPVILCGDFNTPPRGRIYAQLTRKMEDAFAARGFGWGHTFSSKRPVLRIDYVFTSGGASARSCNVPSVRASDHLPVVADINL